MRFQVTNFMSNENQQTCFKQDMTFDNILRYSTWNNVRFLIIFSYLPNINNYLSW